MFVGVGVSVGVGVGPVGVSVTVGVIVGVGVSVAVAVGVGVSVAVAVGVCVAVAVAVGVGVCVSVAVAVAGTGEPEYEQSLRQLAGEEGVSDRLYLLGLVVGEEKVSLYEAADIFVLPTRQENWGLVLTESLACGTPVVASRVGGLSVAIRDSETGYLIPWRCPEPFAERLELLLGNDELRRQFGIAAREEVERFRWSNVAEAVLGLYAEVIDGAPAMSPARFRN